MLLYSILVVFLYMINMDYFVPTYAISFINCGPTDRNSWTMLGLKELQFHTVMVHLG